MRIKSMLVGTTLTVGLITAIGASAQGKKDAAPAAAPAAAAAEKKADKPAAPAAAPAAGEKNPSVGYPKGYREWTHVKSMVIYDAKHPLFGAFGGVHHIYANDKALKALKSKGDYQKGAVFVVDLLNTTEAGGAYAEGARKFIGVMERDTKKYAATEGWGWQVFEGGDANKTAVNELSAAVACATCHKEVGAKHFVFTEWRE
jgi:hypothetical protein